ncbi:hypothetical protein CORC01_10532 [Colletotrichum orchidophilum]|uniref:Oxidoreductase n=1 Tax=Colletotrichum orchidophilum TaxID=1209926 RepID=A0A1G4AYH2_9PEZI|nr:uncharacterized protein CORC01_10532 [Colletotrichum orchidophilum]OHE94194.1 hypothetical protein CORC01_10532 [Colletotrichum orchidophilum]
MATRSLVVGGTGGIGYAIACRLAAASASSQVTISGRTEPKDLPHPNIKFRPLDASSMRSIKRYTDDIKSLQDQQLDLLVLTQGSLTMAGRNETSEGIDRKMALHYYGRQLLIRELSPILKDDAKVLIVLDSTRGSPTKLIWDDLDLKKNFSLQNAANHCLSMTDAVIQAYANENKGKKQHFIHAYPGLVQTNIFHTMPWYLRAPTRILTSVAGVPADTCAEKLLKGVNEASEKDGKFWSCIDQNGKVVDNKAIWTEEDLQKVTDHTWKTIDEALAVPSE